MSYLFHNSVPYNISPCMQGVGYDIETTSQQLLSTDIFVRKAILQIKGNNIEYIILSRIGEIFSSA